MAKIPLRAYIKDIENQIERGEVEQAIGHAKNILKSYPKNIETYRLLGKAFLESQRYSEAADILQRVLSVLPDDFVSQVGMSIIREDEGNLDAAIWHMERAYEVQPFNPAVQEELRRLYGRRDGIEPPKIRLTRGALVRMYTRGELYSQAIAETRAALAEDPQRFDLLVLLARLYYLSNHKNDAAEVCSELLRKLPYCYEANLLLAQFLPSTNRADEAQKFLQRIYALDPYAAFVSPTAPTSDQVPDQAVMVEQFTWESAMEDAQTPEWARNVGVAWEETSEEALPDWLNTLKPEAPSGRATAPAEEETLLSESTPAAEATGAEAPSDELIPDWMKDAGWIHTDRKADDIMAEQGAAFGEEESDEIAPADLPDWVQSIAPRESSKAPEEEERTDWLESILSQPEGENGKASGIVPPPELEKDESQQGLPDWVTGAGTGTQMPAETELPAGDLPDWFSQMAGEKQPGEGEAEPSSELKPADFEGLPDWSQLGEPAVSEPAQDADQTPDWLKSFDIPAAETPTPADQTPDWLQSMESEAPASPEGQAGVTDWLQSVQPEEVEPAADADLPDWLQSLSGEEEQASALPAAERPLDEGLVGAASDILAGFEPSASAEATVQEPSLDVPLEVIQEIPEAEATASAAASAVDELDDLTGMVPDWLTQEETTAPTEPMESVVPAAEQPAQAEAAMPDFSDMDAAMAWLESLAAKQGADEATLVTPPEQRLETPPDWVTKEMEADAAPLQAEAEMPAPTDELPALEETPAAELPDWLKAEAVEGELPGMSAEPASPEEIPAAVAESETSLPDWLQEEEAKAPEETIETAPTPPVAEQPAQAEAAMPDLSDMDAAMAWLESLAAKQGADEATLVTPPEQRLEQPPEWVAKEMEAEAAGGPVIEPAAEAEIPDWLQSLSGEEEKAEVLPTAERPLDEGLVSAASDILAGFEPSESAEAPVQEPSFEVPPEVPTAAAEPEITAEAVPDWLTQEETAAPTEAMESVVPAAEQPAQAEAAMPDFSDMDAAMAWLESLAAKQGADEATLVTPPEQRLEQPPDWVTKEMEAEAAGGLVVEEYLPEETLPIEPIVSTPEAAAEAEIEIPAAEEAVFPDWLQDAIEEETLAAAETPAVEETAAFADVEVPVLPEAEPVVPPEIPVLETPEVETPAAPEAAMDLDSAFAWLESLAEKQGADEGTLVTSPEDRQETPPDWVQQEQERIVETPVDEFAPEAAADVEQEMTVPQTEPQAVVEETTSVVEEPVLEETVREEAVPDWLSSIGQEETAETTPWPGETEAVAGQPSSREPIPDWLKEPALQEESAVSGTDSVPHETPAEEEPVPEWLMDLEEKEAEEFAGAFPQDVDMPTAPGDFRSAWEPEVEIGQPVAKAPAGQPPVAGSLSDIQLSLNQGDLDRALEGYNHFIQSGAYLDETIHDLRDALYRYPVDISIWQTLGDAYARNNQLQEALDAYTKAEELLR